MNEQIKELAKQADPEYTGEYDAVVFSHALVGNSAIEKFAQLIVKECAELCAGTRITFVGKCDLTPEEVANETVKDLSAIIKQHFGIKE